MSRSRWVFQIVGADFSEIVTSFNEMAKSSVRIFFFLRAQVLSKSSIIQRRLLTDCFPRHPWQQKILLSICAWMFWENLGVLTQLCGKYQNPITVVASLSSQLQRLIPPFLGQYCHCKMHQCFCWIYSRLLAWPYGSSCSTDLTTGWNTQHFRQSISLLGTSVALSLSHYY